MVKLGIFVFANNSGLGNQTRRLTEMLSPDVIMAIDSSPFSKNKEQHFEWYDNFTGYKVTGFPNNREIDVFLKGLTHVIVCENPLNNYLLDAAKDRGVKVIIQSNYEFCDHLDKDLTLPHKFLMPSYWHVDTMKEKFGDDRVVYLPPPIHPQEFSEARDVNLHREAQGRPKFLHIVGTLAAEDRNGTLDLIAAVELSEADYDITIRSQIELPEEYMSLSKKINYSFQDLKDPQDLYKNYDALILPRRYGGLSLTTNEALMSGLPVLMSDMSPNNKLLPKEWLFPSEKRGELFTRVLLDVHESPVEELAKKIDWIARRSEEELSTMKVNAFDLAINNFSSDLLRDKYKALLI